MAAHVVDAHTDVNTRARTISSSARAAYALIHRLSPGELRDLQLKASALLSDAPADARGGGQAQITRSDSGIDWLLCGIEAELRARGVLFNGSRLRADLICPKYAALSRPAMATLRAGLGRHPRASDLAALGRLAAECLADYLTSMRVPVTPRTMLQHAGDAAAAVDAAFPGYLASGMLVFVMGAHK